MGEGSIPRLLLEFGIPAIIGILVNSLYNLVDSVFIGHAVGELGLAATAAAFPAMIIMMAFGMLVGGGGNALIAIKLGERDYDAAERILGNMMTLLIIASVVVGAGGLLFIEPILRISGATPEAMPYAISYMSIIFYGLIFQGIGFGMNHTIRTTGRPKLAMGTMLVGAGVNAVLNYVFLFHFGWGVAGSATATIISQALAAALVLRYFLSSQSPLRLRWSNMRLHREYATKSLSLGMASFAPQVAASIVNVVLNTSAVYWATGAALGASGALAAVSVIGKAGQLFVMPVMGLIMAAQPLLGYNYGARNFERVRKVFWTTAGVATAMQALFWIIIQVFPHQLVSVFGLTDTAVTEFAALGLRIDLVLLPVIGFQMLSATYFQATGQPGRSLFLTLSRQVIFLLPGFYLIPHAVRALGGSADSALAGVVWAFPAADIVSTTLSAILILREMAHLDLAHARQVPVHDLDADGEITVRDYEEVVYVPAGEA